jgi:hypothetical protein
MHRSGDIALEGIEQCIMNAAGAIVLLIDGSEQQRGWGVNRVGWLGDSVHSWNNRVELVPKAGKREGWD